MLILINPFSPSYEIKKFACGITLKICNLDPFSDNSASTKRVKFCILLQFTHHVKKYDYILMGFYIILNQCIFNYAMLSTFLSLSFHIKQNMIH